MSSVAIEVINSMAGRDPETGTVVSYQRGDTMVCDEKTAKKLLATNKAKSTDEVGDKLKKAGIAELKKERDAKVEAAAKAAKKKAGPKGAMTTANSFQPENS